MDKQLQKSRQNKIFAGVCGGIGEYLNIDPNWVRVVWALLTLNTGVFLLIYIVAAIIIPENQDTEVLTKHNNFLGHISNSVVTIVGGVLILAGVYYLLLNFNLIPWEFISLIKYYMRNAFFPILLICLGLMLILYKGKK